MSSIAFVVDPRGTKTAVVIDLRRHRKLWEDFYDTLLVELRAHEPRESLASIKLRRKLVEARPSSRRTPQEINRGKAAPADAAPGQPC